MLERPVVMSRLGVRWHLEQRAVAIEDGPKDEDADEVDEPESEDEVEQGIACCPRMDADGPAETSCTGCG